MQQAIWRQLPDVPYCRSSVCIVDGVLLAVGGAEGPGYESSKTSGIYGFHQIEQKWKHVGDLPLNCSFASSETQLLSGGELLVVDGYDSGQVFKITVRGEFLSAMKLFNIIFSGLPKLFPTPHST